MESDLEIKTGSSTIVEPKSRVKKPSLYKVILLNDDYTPMEFVVHVLKKVFKRTDSDATNIMLQVHNEGAGVAGVYSFELAETKVFQANSYSKKNKYPLMSTLEKE